MSECSLCMIKCGENCQCLCHFGEPTFKRDSRK